MAYRIEIKLKSQVEEVFKKSPDHAINLMEHIIPKSLEVIANKAREYLSGTPFSSETGSHVINKRSGALVASVKTQYPYESAYKGVVQAGAKTRYANNPEEYDYGAILEYGRGEIKPKYTPSMQAGKYRRAAIVVPASGGANLMTGVNGFRGQPGQYRFVKRIPPMEGKFWMKAAMEDTAEEVAAVAAKEVDRFLGEVI